MFAINRVGGRSNIFSLKQKRPLADILQIQPNMGAIFTAEHGKRFSFRRLTGDSVLLVM